jgi:hypothetical protein
MESILLGGLALAGFNTVNPKDNKKKKIDDSYGSNMSDIVKNMEKNQAKNLKNSIIEKKPEFLKQFDELTFDNMNEPVSISDSHMTITGVNHSLQRGLDLTNGYSNIDESSHYGVISKEHFTHDNMTPNTSKRDYTLNSDHSARKLEAFTGVSDYWMPKHEKEHLFEPMKDLTYINGMPVMTDYLDDRYLASNKNNMGNLPFQNNVKVRPGLDNDVRQGLGTVYRIAPRTVDELRGEHNQKVSYDNKPLETIKKGEYRAPDLNLTKYKLPDFREVHFEDLVAGRAQTEGSRKTGKFTDVNTQRGDNEVNYSGSAYAPSMGEAPSKNKTTFEPSKKQEMYNDPTHCVVGVNVKPVMQNKNSYVNRETQRASMQATEVGPTFNGNGGSYTLDPSYIPLTTLRQLMIDGNTNIGVSGSQQKANYVFSNDMVLPTTIKESTLSYKRGFANPVEKTGASQFTDSAKQTTKETTLGYRGGFANPTEKTGASQFTDSAKQTTKETTLGYRGGFANPTEKTGASQFTDSAKQTTKETTLCYRGGFANPTEKTGASQFTDSAKQTTKETTLGYRGGFANPTEKTGASQFTDSAKQTTKETTLCYRGGFANPTEKTGASQFTDSAKQTTKETTLGYRGGFANPTEKIGASQFTDSAKQTTKETTLGYRGGFANPTEKTGASQFTDSAKQTTKETTLGYRGGFANPTEKTGASQFTDSAKQTTKETTLGYRGGFANPTEKTGISMLSDTAKVTIKQTTLHTTPGANVGSFVPNGYTKDYNDIAKTTIRQTTENNNYKSNVSGIEAQMGYTRDEKDIAKTTIRQTTENNTYKSNVSSIEAQMGYTRDEKDLAKVTIKQTTLYRTPGMNVASIEAQMGYTRDEKDIAKTTIKQTTENNNYQGPIHGSDNYSGYTRDDNDTAKTTIRQTTHLQDYTGAIHGEEGQTSHLATDNMCIDERREIATYNRTSGGGANLAGPQINKDKVKMNSKKTSIFYVSTPGKSLDQSVMPSQGQSYNNTTENKKPQLSYGDYRTNNIFINTLKDNPLVNDIYHQKHV